MSLLKMKYIIMLSYISKETHLNSF